MNKQHWVVYGIAGYILLFMAVAVGRVLWKAKRRGGRKPVDFRLLRGPGESLRRRIAKFDEDFFTTMTLAALAPPGFRFLPSG